ncbi:thiamine diphosphokinase [Rickettsia endosymbiont of Oedothorax gibbosus]|uniref:thiamine diphosphokinase n=1 Tax=Rickettsia endosymbiont of Oedothorax gibbosus TaxID=931099 RepID=UPI002025721B|nr:thiamine diphosphokinase [Rickettsia endosymbiont of Oedothorax gibbosus]
MQDRYRAFYEHIDTSLYHSILALNGDLPDKSFFDIGLPIIAADGAINSLYKMGIIPKVVIGDLDSAKVDLLYTTEMIRVPDQNSCDFKKSLQYLENKNLLPAIIVGMSGGYIDHILNNISIFLKNGSIFYAPSIVGYVIKAGESRVFTLSVDTKISLLGFSSAQISTKGLKWELEHYQMSFPGTNSSFNRTICETVSIEVHSGLSLVMIYLEKMKDYGSNII